jgi:hypothetical protein
LENLIVYGNPNKFITQLVSRLSVPCFLYNVPLRLEDVVTEIEGRKEPTKAM